MILFILLDWLSDDHVSDSCLKENCELKPNERASEEFGSRLLLRILTIVFLIFFSLSLLSLFQGDYTKSAAYYLCISICAGILIVEIFTYYTQIQGYGILLKTVLISMDIVFANHLIFKEGISLPDLGLHFNLVQFILTSGHVTNNPQGYYNIFSVHHIFASEGILLTGYNPLSIYLLFGSFLIAIGVLFVFIIGKRFVNFQFGLVAAVLFTCLDYYLMYGEHPEHQAYNYGFALICFTLIIYTYRFQKPVFYVLFGLSSVALILSHHLSAALVFVTVCSLLIIDVYRSLQNRELSLPSKSIFATFVILLFTVLLLISNNNSVEFVSNTIHPYVGDIYSLLRNFFHAPAPVISVPGIQYR